ncbi:MAG: hypothetical protein EOM68_00175 [Spirochaetia bacterium]|nr:hypothetical protein [Spirochaetia bacterium]
MSPKPILIGLNSNVGKSGKDTLCEMLNAERFAFGDALKQETARALTETQEEYALLLPVFHNQALKDRPDASLSIKRIPQGWYSAYLYSQIPSLDPSRPRSPRWHLQMYGTMRRNQDTDYWLKVVQGQIEDFMATCESFRKEFIVVTDVRMVNELEWLNRMGGQCFRVERTWPEPAIDNLPKHSSDTALDNADLKVIKNHWNLRDHMLVQLKEYLHEHM